jgi:superoxide dismutase, Fe-Mn family
MPFHLPILPYQHGDLAPAISKETILFHYGRHHKGYVDKMNELLEGSPLKDSALEAIVRNSSGELFNNAAQAWNHTFYWQCLSPDVKEYKPSSALQRALEDSFGSLSSFLEQFASHAQKNFGSGWTWLIRKPGGQLGILNTSNAHTPITGDDDPLLVLDVWEHAYYIDYRNERKNHLAAVNRILNWKFASACFDSAEEFSATNLMVA